MSFYKLRDNSMAIAQIHEDIFQTHILTRLDGRTLTAAGCVSLQLQSLCSDDKLWSDICSSNWPSTNDPLVRQAISNFPSGHRSFFLDTFPSPSHRLIAAASSTSQLISSVDLRYHDKLVLSKVESKNTTPNDGFQSSPFCIDLKEVVPSTVKLFGHDHVVQSNLEKHMTLSWIIIDPIHNRAVNLSCTKPISVHRNWLTDDIELTVAVVSTFRNDYYVKCKMEVTCGLKEGGGELYVSGVSLVLQDVDDKRLNGKDGMVILQGFTMAERHSRRYSSGGEEEQEEMYKKYNERRRERKDKRERRERWIGMAWIASGVVVLMAFWSFVLY